MPWSRYSCLCIPTYLTSLQQLNACVKVSLLIQPSPQLSSEELIFLFAQLILPQCTLQNLSELCPISSRGAVFQFVSSAGI